MRSLPWLALVLLSAGSARAQAPLELTHVRVGYGSVGVVAANAPIPGWVIGTIRLRARAAVHDLTLHSVELLDASGHRVGLAQGELELRAAPSNRSHGDFSRYGTTSLPSTLRPGQEVLIWMHARIDGDFDRVMRAPPARYRARLRTSRGDRLMVEGALEGPWPTA